MVTVGCAQVILNFAGRAASYGCVWATKCKRKGFGRPLSTFMRCAPRTTCHISAAGSQSDILQGDSQRRGQPWRPEKGPLCLGWLQVSLEAN